MRFYLTIFMHIVVLLVLARGLMADESLGFPRNAVLALQGEENPSLINIACGPHATDQIKCKQLKVFIKKQSDVPYSKIFEEVQKTWEQSKGHPALKEVCQNVIKEFPNLDEKDIRDRLAKNDKKNQFQNSKLKQRFALDFTMGIRNACAEPFTEQTAAKLLFEFEKKSSALCYFDWMPDYEKTYSLDPANQQWTYRIDTNGLCGREITTENIRPLKSDDAIAARYLSRYELEILTTYPDMESGSGCQLGLEPKPLKKIYSTVKTKFTRECIGFFFE